MVICVRLKPAPFRTPISRFGSDATDPDNGARPPLNVGVTTTAPTTVGQVIVTNPDASIEPFTLPERGPEEKLPVTDVPDCVTV
jgi:hypothetical protein